MTREEYDGSIDKWFVDEAYKRAKELEELDSKRLPSLPPALPEHVLKDLNTCGELHAVSSAYTAMASGCVGGNFSHACYPDDFDDCDDCDDDDNRFPAISDYVYDGPDVSGLDVMADPLQLVNEPKPEPEVIPVKKKSRLRQWWDFMGGVE